MDGDIFASIHADSNADADEQISAAMLSIHDDDVSPESAPEQYQIAIGDFVIFHSEKDTDQADELFEKVDDIMKGNDVTGYMHDLLSANYSIFKAADEIRNVCIQAWFLVTENFIADKSMGVHKDEALMKALTDEGLNCVPIWTKDKGDYSRVPYGLAAYQGLNVHDKHFEKRLKRMFAMSQHQEMKKKLRVRQQSDKQRWLEDEKERRREKAKLHKQHLDGKLDWDLEQIRAENYDVQIRENVERKLREYVQQSTERQENNDEIPGYLQDSLNSVRSQSLQSGNVYNVTIHNPGQVTIGHAAAGDDTLFKNLMVDGANPILGAGKLSQQCSSASSRESFDMIDATESSQ